MKHVHIGLVNMYLFTQFKAISHSTANHDYNVTSVTLTFQPGLLPVGQNHCANISIFDDDVLEDTESFFVVLGSVNEDVKSDPGRDNASVFITDDDGEGWASVASHLAFICKDIVMLSLVVVTVGWKQQMYEVIEDEGLQNVCIILTGETDRAVQIRIETIEGTAAGKSINDLCINCCYSVH